MSFTPITRATLNATLANSSQCPSPWYPRLRVLWELVGNRKKHTWCCHLGNCFSPTTVKSDDRKHGLEKSLQFALLWLLAFVAPSLSYFSYSIEVTLKKIFVDSSKLGFNFTVSWEYCKTNSKYPFILFTEIRKCVVVSVMNQFLVVQGWMISQRDYDKFFSLLLW